MVDILPKAAVITAANDFAEAAQIIYDQMPSNCYPLVVNATLSIELYLKAYLSKPANPREGALYPRFTFIEQSLHKHTLSELYKAIPPDIKKKIDDEFSRTDLSGKFGTLDLALVKIANSFIEARYPFEKNHHKGHPITDIMDICKFFKKTVPKLGDFRCERNP